MIFDRLRNFDVTTAITGLALRRLYGRERKLHPLIRKMLLFLPRNFHLLGRAPLLTRILPVFDPAKSNFSVIPINENIEGAGDMALPIEIIDRLIDISRERAVLSHCVCRQNHDCLNYPENFGCLFLGESSRETPASWRRMVSKEEAKAHARKGVSLGLVPMVGKIRFDSDTLGIKDRGKLMTVCFCCECCCLGRYLAKVPAPVVDRLQHPVEGVRIEITDACVGCGTCVDACYLQAMEIVDGKASRKDICRVCGRCAARCPQKAIKISLCNPNVVDDVVKRLLTVVEI